MSAVLRRAAEESVQLGLTVAQVQEIARDVGLSPDAVSRALIESASGALLPATVDRSLGVPVGVAKDITLPGRLSDEGWDVLVSMLRSTFGARGKEVQSGVVREWRNGKLRIAVEPAAGGSRLRMSTEKDGALRVPALAGGFSLLQVVTLLAQPGTNAGATAAAAVVGALGVACVAWPFLSLPKWGRTRADQFDAVAREAMRLAEPLRNPELGDGTHPSGN
ncbi:MAG TPA: hypothetical protein VE861_15535 [Gemmatimonadaceae bacterium]|nr:hypothetical protein [Gemmatimonadaceae bacterium]